MINYNGKEFIDLLNSYNTEDIFNYMKEPLKSVLNNDELNIFMNLVNKIRNHYILNGQSNLVNHALKEFKFAGWYSLNSNDTEHRQELIMLQIIDSIILISLMGHSGSSIQYYLNLLNILINYKLITPLQESDTWIEVANNIFQSSRAHSVFKIIIKGKPVYYDIDAVIVEYPDGNRYTNSMCHRIITFPYTPQVELVIVKVDDDGNILDGQEDIYPLNERLYLLKK